ncbi:MAG: TonB-dependent receptor [Ferruginibacter sp.]|nr:TonB-dependent receptor [Cytophagales bacterium]
MTNKSFLFTAALFWAMPMAWAQNRAPVSGRVTAEAGEIFPGVSVSVKGTTTGTVTDVEGRYALSLPDASSTLVFSFVGFVTQEVPAANRSVIDVVLIADVKALSELVVTGYQTQNKADLTGSVAVINMTETKNIPVSNPLLALQGRVPGLYVEADGSPNGGGGGSRRVLIRGLNTLGDASPLYIIDGVPTKRPQVFASLNPTSIESVQVLKDASAASIYGSRASNGVIIVTTKQGKARGGQEKLSIQFNSNVSVQTVKPWQENVLNAEQRGRALWRAAVNDNTNPTVHAAIYTYDWNGDYTNPILNRVNVNPFVGGDTLVPVGNTNWQDESYEPAFVTQQDLSLSAGTGKSSLLINLGYFKNSGTLVYTNYERLSARINAYTSFFDGKLRIGENLMLARSTQTLAAADLGGASTPDLAVTLAPTIPVFRQDGAYAGPVGAGYSDRNNPVHMQQINRLDRNNELLAFGNVYAEIEPVKNLLFRTSFGVDYSNQLAKNIEPAFQEGFLGRNVNSLALQQANNLSLTWTNTLNYAFDFGSHRITALLGTEAIRQDNQSFGAFREGFALEDENYYYLDAGTGRSTNNGAASASRLLSYFGKVFYAFSDKYLASVTVRRDGSSRFGSANKYGVFPALSLGWRMNSEGFLSGVGAISNLKLRAGIGRVGNQEIGDVARFGLFQPNYGTIGTGFPGSWLNSGTAYDLNGANVGTLPSGYVQVQGENQNLKWESTEELNVGVDFGFLNEKISGSFDYFTRNTEDILIQPPIAGAVGEGRIRYLNGASKSNRGWEFILGYQHTAGDWTYSITGNASRFRDKVTALPAEVRTAYPGNAQQSILGQSQLAIFGYQTDGLFQSQAEVDAHATQTGKGPGRIRYRDLNGDGTINALDQTWLGTQLPSLEYGLRVNLGYKNFDLSVFGSGIAGKTGNDPVKGFNSFASVNSNNGPGVLDAWTPQNTGSTTPMLSLVNRNNENRASDFFNVNGSYFKLRNVQLGYSLPSAFTQRLKMESLRLYVVGQNLFVLKDEEYLSKDPERIGSLTFWPQPTSFTLGLNVTL